MLDHVLDQLADAGINRCVVNTHYLAAHIQSHLQKREHPEITLSHEEEILDTGGGIAKALPHFKDKPFFVINADIWWRDGDQSCFHTLSQRWDASQMDMLLLLTPRETAIGYTGTGDYFLTPDGRARYRDTPVPAPYIYSGIRLMHPRIFPSAATGAFSIVPYFHKAEEQGRLYGVIHNGEWGDIGTPESLEAVNAHISRGGEPIP